MFQNPFSFNGRITRQEFLLSKISSLILVIAIFIWVNGYEYDRLFLQFILIIYFWFNFSQAAKRAHDFNHNGFMQIIPFYFFALLFEEGTNGTNKYGKDPDLTNY